MLVDNSSAHPQAQARTFPLPSGTPQELTVADIFAWPQGLPILHLGRKGLRELTTMGGVQLKAVLGQLRLDVLCTSQSAAFYAGILHVGVSHVSTASTAALVRTGVSTTTLGAALYRNGLRRFHCSAHGARAHHCCGSEARVESVCRLPRAFVNSAPLRRLWWPFTTTAE